MLLACVLILSGVAALYGGAEAFVSGASSLARGLRISAAIVGLTVVSLASSSPEFVATLTAALRGSPDMGLGNILGSNIANIGLVLGLSALVRPMKVSTGMVRTGVPFVLFSIVLLFVFARDGKLDALNGLGLLAVCGAFMAIQVRGVQRHRAATAHEPPAPIRPVRDPVLLVLGVLGMVVGADLLVRGASTIARGFGVTELFIGLSVVAVGTSLPELATSIVAAWRGHEDIAIGNVLGSNVLNVVFVLALVTIVSPLAVAPAALHQQFPLVLGFSVALLPLLRSGRGVSRWEGGLLVAAYVGYLVFSFRS